MFNLCASGKIFLHIRNQHENCYRLEKKNRNKKVSGKVDLFPKQRSPIQCCVIIYVTDLIHWYVLKSSVTWLIIVLYFQIMIQQWENCLPNITHLGNLYFVVVFCVLLFWYNRLTTMIISWHDGRCILWLK